jgi:2-hydroxy-6-oxonona-2,4-dienedioate hydrolase
VSAFNSIWSDLAKASFRQGYLDAGGIRTRFLASGTADRPLLLFLHGTGGHAEAYTRNLEAHGKYFNTVAIDMLGHGWTDKPPIDYEIPAYAEHVIKVLDALGQKRALISGESLGGWVATYLAIHHRERLERIVLNTAGGWTAHPEVMEKIKRLSMEVAADPTHERMRARLEFLMYDKRMVHDDLVEARLRIYKQPNFLDITRRILCLQEMPIRRRNMFTRQMYAGITTPTFVLWTSHDPTATVDEGRELASMIPSSQFVVMNNCGHWPQFEDADLFNRIHLDFLLGSNG